jgi:hypothetical protein
MRGAAAFLAELVLGDFAIVFPLSCVRIQHYSEEPAPDESESYLNLRKFHASVFGLFREEQTPRASGQGSVIQNQETPARRTGKR